MRIAKILLLVLVLTIVTGCSCRTRRVGPGNIPIARGEGALYDINFAFDSYALDEPAKTKLRANADWLDENSRAQVTIEGHCDERGTAEYNMVLGANRAQAVQDYLRSLGVSNDRMSTVSYGEEVPLDPGHTPAAWSKNRRAHFEIR